MRNILRGKIQGLALVAATLVAAFFISGCVPTGGSWAADPATGELVIVTTPWAAADAATSRGSTTAPSAGSSGNGLRYDNAGRKDEAGNLIDTGCQLPGVGLAPGQSETVAYIICNATSPTDAWVKIQAQVAAAGTQGVITAPSGTELAQALPIRQAWVVWNSTCPAPTADTPQDVPVVTRDTPGPGCIRFVPEYGGGARTYSFEQTIPVW